MASGDAPPSFSSGFMKPFDQEQFQVDAEAAFGVQNNQPWPNQQPPSQGSFGHGQANSVNQVPDGIVHRGFGYPDGVEDNQQGPSFTAFGRGQGMSNNQVWNSSREYIDGGQPLSISAMEKKMFSNPSDGGHFYSGGSAPGISDVDRRGVSATGPGGSSTDFQNSASEQDMAGMSLVGRNFKKHYPNAYYKE